MEVKVDMDEAFGHWFAGFVDGEGCFAIVPNKGGFYCRFQLRLRDDDREIIETIQRETGLGKIYSAAAQGASKPQINWHVGSQEECLALVELLDRYPLRARKRRDYEVWREAVLFWSRTRYTRGDGAVERWKHMSELYDRLRQARKY